MTIKELIAIFHHRWSAPVLAELLRQRGSRFAALSGTLGVGRESLRRTLDSLLALGLVARNPGYGHPLRPEYVLTRRGEDAARRCAAMLAAADDDVVLRKWSLPVLAALDAGALLRAAFCAAGGDAARARPRAQGSEDGRADRAPRRGRVPADRDLCGDSQGAEADAHLRLIVRRERQPPRACRCRSTARSGPSARRGRGRARSTGPCPSAPPPIPAPESAIASRISPSRRTSSIRTSPPPCSSAFWSSSLKTSASAVAREPASATGSSADATRACRPPIPCTSIARNRSSRSSSSTSSSRRSVSTSWTAAIARILLTECSSASRGSTDVGGARLQPQQRRDGLQVVLDPVVDLLGEHATHHRSTVLERDGRVVRDRDEQLPIVVGERCVAVADELADLPAAPPQREALGVAAGAPLRPRDLPVLEHERRSRRVERVHRRAHDRGERLLEVEGLGNRLGDTRQGLELDDPALGRRVEPCVLDRLRDLSRDRDQQLDLGTGELALLDVRTFSAPSSFSRARIGTTKIDWNRSSAGSGTT